MTPQSMSELIEAGWVAFRFSLEEDCWQGKYKGSAYRIYLHKWNDLPYQEVDLHGYRIRCVKPEDLHGTVAMPVKDDRVEPAKVRKVAT